MVLEENLTYEVSAFEANAVDTNGAGDMFAGGVIHGLSEGWENASASSPRDAEARQNPDVERVAGVGGHHRARVLLHHRPRGSTGTPT